VGLLLGARPAAQAQEGQYEGFASLGADAPIHRTSGDIIGQLGATAPDGLDAVLALAGGETLLAYLDVVRGDARVVYPNGVEPEWESRAGVRVVSYDAAAGPRGFAELEEAVEQAHLQVPISGAYPLERAAEAHVQLEAAMCWARAQATESAASDFPVAALSHQWPRRSAQRRYSFTFSFALGSSPGL
jgi:NADPH:quinone reductase